MVKRARKFSRLNRRSLLLGALVVVLVGLGVWGLTRHKQSSTAAIPSTSASSAPATSSDKTTKNGIPSSSSTSSDKSSPGGSSLALIAPWGDFVSNHSPGKNGAPTSETSTCNTTPGASCYIQFTKDGASKNLDTKVADNNGSVIWSWDVKAAGLSSGSWRITAIASLNGQSKSTADQLALEVQ